MKRSAFSLRRFQEFWRNRSGSTLVAFGVMIPTFIGAAGLSVDVGIAYVAKRALELRDAGGGDGRRLRAAVDHGQYHRYRRGHGVAFGQSRAKRDDHQQHADAFMRYSDDESAECNGSNPNVVTVTQTGTVDTYFSVRFGRSLFTLTSTATAARAGGNAKSLNVMFVIDATRSMGDADSTARFPASPIPTRWQCALYSVQSVLKTMPTSLDQVGLMVFPGLRSQYSPRSTCSQPNTVPYLRQHQIPDRHHAR